MLKLESLLQKCYVISAFVLLIVSIVEISLIGKNLSYSSHFTPPSTQKSLRNQSYFSESQVLIIILCLFTIIILPFLIYVMLAKTKRLFIPIWISFIALSSVLLLVVVYYLLGSIHYRNYLAEIYKNIKALPNFCEQNLCNKVTCARISTFKESRAASIAFLTISTICCMFLSISGFVINRNRRKSSQIQLIM